MEAGIGTGNAIGNFGIEVGQVELVFAVISMVVYGLVYVGKVVGKNVRVVVVRVEILWRCVCMMQAT
jgi:hypothetical protein